MPPGLLQSTLLTGWVPTLLRAGRGMSRWDGALAEAPQEPLQLWNYENNQFCRKPPAAAAPSARRGLGGR